jgi:hypothetical protein
MISEDKSIAEMAVELQLFVDKHASAKAHKAAQEDRLIGLMKTSSAAINHHAEADATFVRLSGEHALGEGSADAVAEARKARDDAFDEMRSIDAAVEVTRGRIATATQDESDAERDAVRVSRVIARFAAERERDATLAVVASAFAALERQHMLETTAIGSELTGDRALDSLGLSELTAKFKLIGITVGSSGGHLKAFTPAELAKLLTPPAQTKRVRAA